MLNQNNELLVVLGQQLPLDGDVSADLMLRLDEVVKYNLLNPIVKIIVCGKYAISYEKQAIKPSKYESRAMKEYLVLKGVPANLIICESRSKDTIGNAYYSKQIIKKLPNISKINIACSTAHQNRVNYIFSRIYGTNYYLNYIIVKPNNNIKSQRTEDYEMKKLLRPGSPLFAISNGNDASLKHQLYKSKYYKDFLKTPKN